MSLLFDISPTDEPQKKRSGKKKQAEEAAAAPEPAVVVPKRISDEPPKPLGAADGFVCINEACGGTCHDIWKKSRGLWLIECFECGTGQWVEAQEEAQETEEDSFRFPEGVRDTFVGLTIDEVDALGRRDYIVWAAENCRIGDVRDAAKNWLAARG